MFDFARSLLCSQLSDATTKNSNLNNPSHCSHCFCCFVSVSNEGVLSCSQMQVKARSPRKSLQIHLMEANSWDIHFPVTSLRVKDSSQILDKQFLPWPPHDQLDPHLLDFVCLFVQAKCCTNILIQTYSPHQTTTQETIAKERDTN